ncbi:MAG: ABC transporter permease [Candidatus Pacebacteria bacterium]|nr:ABC transporter permease [Candidatus Paceibacterota bacterium]
MNSNRFYQLLIALTQKEIKARYKNALLGFLWIFINPIIQMLVIGFVFSLIFHFGIKRYYLFLFTGLLPWNFFSLSLNKATQRIVWDRHLIQKASFPRSVIPLSVVLSHFVHFLISWGLLLIFLLFTRQWQFFYPQTILFQLWAILLLFFFTGSLSLITSCLNVFYRDVSFFTQAGILIWFYATPIVYPLSAIPVRFRPLFYLNPLSGVISLLQQPVTELALPSTVLLGQTGLVLLVAVLGFRLFVKKEKYFSDWV